MIHIVIHIICMLHMMFDSMVYDLKIYNVDKGSPGGALYLVQTVACF